MTRWLVKVAKARFVEVEAESELAATIKAVRGEDIVWEGTVIQTKAEAVAAFPDAIPVEAAG